MAGVRRSAQGYTQEETRILIPGQHPGQLRVRRESKRFNALCAGRRWRKTSLCLTIAIEAALKGKVVVWGAPTNDQARSAFLECRKAVKHYNFTNVTYMEAAFPDTNGIIKFRSLDDPGNIKGFTADVVILDEAARVKAEAWYETLQPFLMDTGGSAWLISTPLGRNWYWNEWKNFSNHPDAMSWAIPSLGCYRDEETNELVRAPHPYENPHLKFEELKRLYTMTPWDTFRQEYLAEFLTNEGGVFRRVRENTMMEQIQKPADHIGHRIVCGVDWGQKHDYTVFSVFCQTCMEECELMRLNRLEYEFLRSRLVKLVAKWRVCDILVEANAAGQPNLEALVAEDMPARPFYTTPATKPKLIQSMVLSLEQDESLWLGIPQAVKEMEDYESKVLVVTGRVQYGAPRGESYFDDIVIARCLALWAAITPSEIEFN